MLREWLEELRPAVVLLSLLTLLTGLAYPLAMTGVAQVAFPAQASGSLIEKDGRVVGSRLIGQSFAEPGRFWGRLSATGPVAYAGEASSGSNLGPLAPALLDGARTRAAALREADPGNRSPIPVDLVTSSASGLDPEISPAAAEWQAPRVARARGVDEERILALVETHTRGRTLGILGEPRVNVLELNLALESLSPLPMGGRSLRNGG